MDRMLALCIYAVGYTFITACVYVLCVKERERKKEGKRDEKRTATFATLNVPLEYYSGLLSHWWTHKCNGTLMKIFSINPQFPDRNGQKGDATIGFHCTFRRYEANSGFSSCIFFLYLKWNKDGAIRAFGEWERESEREGEGKSENKKNRGKVERVA